MITKAGAKLLDFGLAKQLAPAGADSTAAPLEVTADGAILGTFQYMAPEQVEGRPTDARTDIFAFGVLVYEMFTGQKAFAGGSRAALIGAILKDEPSLLASDQTFPTPQLARALRRCLAKEPDERWQSAADLTRELQWIAEHPDQHAPARHHRHVPKWIAAVTVAVAALTALGWWTLRLTPSPERELRLSVMLPAGTSMFPVGPTSRFALSPDGRRLAFVATRPDSRPRLFVRTLNELQPVEIPGTEGALLPFWAPDSQSIGFVADNVLKRLDLGGGAVRTLASAPAVAPASWSRDGVILFTPTRTSGLHQIPAFGGEPQLATTPDLSKGELAHVAPYFLPDGRTFLYLALIRTATGRSIAGGVYAASLDSTAPPKLILAKGSNVAYSAGRLLYMRESSLVAQPFDLASLALSGEPVSIADRVTRGGYFAFGQGLAFSASEQGTLAYQTGEPVVGLTWLDRRGQSQGLVGEPLPPDSFADVALARNSRLAAVNTFDVANQATSVWSYDLERPLKRRLTLRPVDEMAPVVSPDGTRVVYASRRRGPLDLFERNADGSGSDTEVLADARDKYPMSWSADGRYLLFVVNPPGEVWALSLTGDRQVFPVVRGSFMTLAAQLSPDGRWIAYSSTESGRPEIYVTEFPMPRTKTVVSTSEGDHPRWRGDGKEVFFRSRGTLMAASASVRSGRLVFDQPRPLFDIRQAIAIREGGSSRYFYDVAADGQRFLFGIRMTGAEGADRGESAGSISLLVNWPASLVGR
jgi:hypothetical protein